MMDEPWDGDERSDGLSLRELEGWRECGLWDEMLWELKRINMALDMLLEMVGTQRDLLQSLKRKVTR